MTDSLEQYVQNWSPAPVETTGIVSRERVDQLVATLDLESDRFGGAELPTLWHWIGFQDWPRTAELGPDGHPAEGHFHPPIPNRRRMFAGSEIRSHTSLLIDETIRRTSFVDSVAPKSGSSGQMLFVTVRNEYSQRGRIARTELQKIVYRSEAGGSTRSIIRPGGDPVPGTDVTWRTDHRIESPTLFRFSALTANAHRIHYDAPYSTGIEGYPGLVVHGPLLAVLMADLAEKDWGVDSLASFAFRLRHPVFDRDPFLVEGTVGKSNDTADLTVRSGDGDAATATAVRR